MFKEKDILLTEARLKQKAKINVANSNDLSSNNLNTLNIPKKKSAPKIAKSGKMPKFLNLILVITTLIILFVALILIILKTIRITKSNINYKNLIPISFSLNDNYAYPLIVSLTSILYNSPPDTFFIFYLLLHPDLQETKIKKILGIKDKYQNCKFELIHMGNNYSIYPDNYNKSAAIYYKLELSNLISDFDKIIYLDVDTIVHKDINEMYDIDMKKYYYIGFPAHNITNSQSNEKKNLINTGVLLINLKELRKVNGTKLLQDYYNVHNNQKVDDEYLINSVFYDKISFLPFIYGIPDFGAGNELTKSPSHFCQEFQNQVNISVSVLENASKNRVITHNYYEDIKWWMKNYNNLTDFGKQWLFYASKSNVFDEICKNYNQFESQCEKIKKEGV